MPKPWRSISKSKTRTKNPGMRTINQLRKDVCQLLDRYDCDQDGGEKALQNIDSSAIADFLQSYLGLPKNPITAMSESGTVVSIGSIQCHAREEETKAGEKTLRQFILFYAANKGDTPEAREAFGKECVQRNHTYIHSEDGYDYYLEHCSLRGRCIVKERGMEWGVFPMDVSPEILAYRSKDVVNAYAVYRELHDLPQV